MVHLLFSPLLITSKEKRSICSFYLRFISLELFFLDVTVALARALYYY
jgi:hypothetical protein